MILGSNPGKFYRVRGLSMTDGTYVWSALTLTGARIQYVRFLFPVYGGERDQDR